MVSATGKQTDSDSTCLKKMSKIVEERLGAQLQIFQCVEWKRPAQLEDTCDESLFVYKVDLERG